MTVAKLTDITVSKLEMFYKQVKKKKKKKESDINSKIFELPS